MTRWKINLLYVLLLMLLAGCAASDYGYGAAYYYNQKKYDEAIENAKQAIEMDPTYPYAWYWLGMAYIEKKQYHEAIEAFNKRITLKPYPQDTQYKGSFTWLGLAYFKTGQIDKAYAAAKRALELSPNNSGARTLMQKIQQTKTDAAINKEVSEFYTALNSKNFALAMSELKDLRTKIFPTAWLDHAGNFFLSTCDYDEALRAYQMALKQKPNEKWIPHLEGRMCFAYSMKKDVDSAKRYCKGLGHIGVSIKVEDKNVVIHSATPNLPAAKAGLEAGDHILQAADTPVEDINQFISLVKKMEPGNPLVIKIRRGKQEIEKTVTVGSVLDSSGPANSAYCKAQALNREGVALARQRNNTAALVKFQEALKTAQGPLAKADYNAALVLEQMGQARKAISHYIKARDQFILPEDETGATNRLVALAKQANIPIPESADQNYRLGILRTKQKRYKEAVQALEAAIAEAPWMSLAYYNLGLVYDFNGQHQKALQALNTYVKLEPDAVNIGMAKSKIVELKDRLGLLPGSKKQTDLELFKKNLSKSTTSRGWLGAGINPDTDDIKSYLPSTGGALIVFVMKGSPAEKAGLKPTDVIVAFDNKNVTSRSQLWDLLRQTRSGQVVTIKAIRGGSTINLQVKLSQRPASQK